MTPFVEHDADERGPWRRSATTPNAARASARRPTARTGSDLEDQELAELVARAEFVVYTLPGGGRWCGASELEDRLTAVEVERDGDDTVAESALRDDPTDPVAEEPEDLARTALWSQLWQSVGGVDPETAEKRANAAPASDAVLVLDGVRVTGVALSDGEAWAVAAVVADQSVVVRGRGRLPAEIVLEAAGR